MNVNEIEKYIDKYIQKKKNLDENNRLNMSNDEKQPLNENDQSPSGVVKETAKMFTNQLQSPFSQAPGKKSIERVNTSKG